MTTFGVINARELARKVVHNCILCFRYKPKLLNQIIGDLPSDRLRSVRPFLICGVDFCGPVYTTHKIRGRPPYKSYIAIFVCFNSKAVHIESVSDLSTNAVLSVFKRFVGRRGVSRAPHFGGLWEAAVKSAKHRMLRTIGDTALTFEELSTVLVGVEAILNSRPVVGSDDPNDGEAITPAHLLIGHIQIAGSEYHT
ncbi:PREDICTED: uncharacterized protein LOC108376560 [Rhagoletis zephyria]|uniref:uncharacterized protein LOC108376560 n=1 Tax=Rhagoletis zephyria TaxID=28612 RepID=UPI0008117EBA|nr:PREDICTED: uncharacterized protein LOC108376560 [Rhagoletis zephyria]